MLVVGKVGRTRAAYYLEHLTPEDDPRGGLSERPGGWFPDASDLFGLAGAPVGHEALGRLLAGRHPRDGTRLHPAVDRVRVAAFDLTFTAPKSVSLLHALGPGEAGEAVVAAHARSVEAALSYLARQGLAVRRRRAGSPELRPAAGMLGAAFVHRTSRASDPHLHTHALLVNLAADGEGRFSALDSRPLYLHLRTVSALYDAHLRNELSRVLEVTWRAHAAGHFDLAGLPDRVLEAFSTRSREIAEELAAAQRTGPRAARVAALRTRRAKDRSRPYPALVEAWRESAYDLGVSDGRWRAVLGPGWPRAGGAERATPGLPEPDPVEEARGLIGKTADHLELPFTRRELLAEGARRSAQGVDAAHAERAADDLLATSPALELLGERAAVLGGPGRPLPVGRTEAVFRSERLARLEAALATGLGRLGPPSWADGRLEGTVVVAARPGGHLELLDELAARARAAAAEGRPVRAHAPTARDAAAFQALTGIPTSAGPRPPLPGPERLLLVVSADELHLAALEQLVTVSGARQAPLALVIGPGTALGRARPPQRDLLLALARPLGGDRWSAADLAARTGAAPGGPTGMARGQVAGERVPADRPPAPPPVPAGYGVSYVPSLKAAVGLAIGELAGRRRTGERAVLVAPDRPVAAALDRLVPSDARHAVADLPPVARVAELAVLAERRLVETAVVLGAESHPGPDHRVVRLAVLPIAPLERPAGELRLTWELARDRDRGAGPLLRRVPGERPGPDRELGREGIGWGLG